MQEPRYYQNDSDCKTLKVGAKIWVPNTESRRWNDGATSIARFRKRTYKMMVGKWYCSRCRGNKSTRMKYEDCSPSEKKKEDLMQEKRDSNF